MVHTYDYLEEAGMWLSLATYQTSPKSNGLKQPFIIFYVSSGWMGSAGWVLLGAVHAQMAAEAWGIWKLEWAGYPRRLSHMLAGKAGCQLECPRLVSAGGLGVSQHGSWVLRGSISRGSVSRGRKQKPPGQLRAEPTSLSPYSTGPCGHRPTKIQEDQVDSTSWRWGGKVTLLRACGMGDVAVICGKESKFLPRHLFFFSPPSQGFANICGPHWGK